MTKRSVVLFTLMLVAFASQSQLKRAILEDFRGHKCGLCPAGDVVAQNISEKYNDSVIVVAIHAGSLSTPNSTGSHTTDFRTSAGNTYNSAFNIVGTPTGIVNRSAYNGNIKLGKDDWENAVKEVISTPSSLHLVIRNGYDSNSRFVTIEVKNYISQSLTGNYSTVVYVLEDSIYDWQTDYNASPTQVESYLHNHVLRDNVNGTWGTQVISTSANAGDSIISQFSYPLDEAWDENHISFVAYTYDESNKEIRNAQLHHIDLNTPSIFEIDTTLSVNENSLDALVRVYPNPADDYFTVHTPEMKRFDLLDVTGKVVRDGLLTNQSIPTHQLDAGIYILRIAEQHGYKYKRLSVR